MAATDSCQEIGISEWREEHKTQNREYWCLGVWGRLSYTPILVGFAGPAKRAKIYLGKQRLCCWSLRRSNRRTEARVSFAV